ncbi:nitroreductase family deazaflavin-dependent oxidoreductase [Kribbella antibiotica]|uniref:Nitroreductase family deazaflavin-dependent oxidoreductase n=1 Tax=Kribbella antibiotica TaxID=190195 RepID=A0A4R4YQA7_9ACTN|nr:nitroreductase/quinone reductase family protein [Kribbella antibiotica]TDD46329.1 nitroreductase family deazaflavin-dependent oxidoreductase [Kribbella antibiotica]
MPNPFSDALISEFRANDGRLSGPFADARMLLLTTTGRRTGRPHTAIIGYYPDGGRVLVVGSAGGADKHPDWYLNLLANPEVTVESGLFTYQANAVPLEGPERDEVFARLVEADEGWGKYQAGTTRTIPVIALTQKQIGPPRGGGSFADLLIRIHKTFRHELALIRDEVAKSGTAGIGAQLRVNCLTLCQGLHHHHIGESQGIFPGLLQQHPELSDEINALLQEHDQLAVHLEELEKLLTTPRPDLLPEIDRIVAVLNKHLDHEEAALLAFL